ncbi:DNA helicase RecQ [Apibacter muscae]|uniref:DNA helicase RecQ n=1 Tax=Apibacter muscae TaxID=2509004 RepID=A0A563D8Y2_9FLAO|nr:DNA helicase RecQ [Apibacter muscae]TWP22735.1 DNA helicase RecQ [Apibacter muscae]TWP26655.1 DNA helicase RecQ [Apibacter muscae]
MNSLEKDLSKSLKKYFGFSTFKKPQEEIITSLLEGNNVFVLMPTGGGKSLCYQLPALISNGTAIVVSPLIALMKNQVDAIRGISSNEGVAHVLNSSQNKTEIKKVKDDIISGVTKLLYVAPESLIKEEYVEFLKSIEISFFAIDEAHCISEWGHDFRPEYRNLRAIIEKIGKVPIIALTATATPKVQDDIQKNLGMTDAKVFKSSFNRPNLFYEVRSKINPEKQIIKYIKENPNKSGIIYCLSRKKVEELAELLKINGINALPYHAGLESKLRASHQDKFLMEEVDVICATIAFGMGIDKPDVRFVFHYDIPKSLESYYQETGRAGRDGGEGKCIAFYDYKDIEKLEKFLASKSVSEREIGMQLLQEVVGYAETSMSRRKYLLHYFGEVFDEVNGLGAKMDDNSLNPKPLTEVSKEIQQMLSIVEKTKEKLKIKDLVHIATGKETAIIKSYKISSENYFGFGKDKTENFWKSIVRQAIVHNFLAKDIETYGVLKLTDLGKSFISNPTSIQMAEDWDYNQEIENSNTIVQPSGNNNAIDKTLFEDLKNIRKKVAKKFNIPPFAVFQDPSLEDMALQYPTSLVEMGNIFGVGEGKAKKFGKEFIDYIAKYIEDHDIIKPDDLVIKQIANKSSHKVFIIQNTDRKLDFEDIAKAKDLSMSELLDEMESIVYQGTKLNINYYVDELLDEDQQQEIIDFLMESESDKMSVLLEEFGEDYSDEELRIMRIKFISDVAN